MFKKNIIVGVSVSADKGLEVAQIDYAHNTVLKYANKPLAYDNSRKEIADLDIFKETLLDTLIELNIPKGSEIVINIPTVIFKVGEYNASTDDVAIKTDIIAQIVETPEFRESDMAVSFTKLSNSTIQFNRIAYIAAQRTMLIELAMQVKELGYTLVGIDTSVNSTLNGLIYSGRANIQAGISWAMLIVDNNQCRILSMIGNSYVDASEEKIAIGEVLGEAENYATVVSAVTPYLEKIPSQYLYVISQTDIINAEVLASKLSYTATIIHLNDNVYTSEPLLPVGPEVDESLAKSISLGVIGAAIKENFSRYAAAKLNLYNEDLGDIYILEQPLSITIGEKKYVLSLQNMLIVSIIICGIILAAAGAVFVYYFMENATKTAAISQLDNKISELNDYIKNNDVSGESFDEGDEVRMGLTQNKNIYSYYTIIGTEIPKKLWLTKLYLGNHTTIEGQADNLESVYSFFRNIKDYNPDSNIKLVKLGLATVKPLSSVAENEKNENFDTKSILTTMNADFYRFVISDSDGASEPENNPSQPNEYGTSNGNQNGKSNLPPNLESIEE